MPIELTIVTPAGAVFDGPVDRVTLPGSEGEFEVLPEHERFLCPLRVGEVQIRSGGTTTYAAIAAGFADVSAEQVAVLVDSCELAEDIDTARAELAVRRAEEGLAALDRDAEAARVAEFEAELERARNWLEVSRRPS
jgi:F-type H+-transporting ATPase subunit epsilon